MANRIPVLDDLEERTVEELLRDVVRRQETLTVRLPGGETVDIQPSPFLKPLPEFDGSIDAGWKDAIHPNP